MFCKNNKNFFKIAALATAARIKLHGLYVPASKQVQGTHNTHDVVLPDNNKPSAAGKKIAEDMTRIQESPRLLIRLRRVVCVK